MKVYVLKLSDGKYYVGKTNKPTHVRYKQHKSGKGSAWTKKYPPISIQEEMDTSDDHKENNVTIDYMKKYGIDNVRGGMYSQVVLSDVLRTFIEGQYTHNSNSCYRCLRPGHVQRFCSESTRIDGSPIVRKRRSKNDKDDDDEDDDDDDDEDDEDDDDDEDEDDDDDDEDEDDDVNFDVCVTCIRCGRDSHTVENCYASKHVNGSTITKEKSIFCSI